MKKVLKNKRGLFAQQHIRKTRIIKELKWSKRVIYKRRGLFAQQQSSNIKACLRRKMRSFLKKKTKLQGLKSMEFICGARTAWNYQSVQHSKSISEGKQTDSQRIPTPVCCRFTVSVKHAFYMRIHHLSCRGSSMYIWTRNVPNGKHFFLSRMCDEFTVMNEAYLLIFYTNSTFRGN